MRTGRLLSQVQTPLGSWRRNLIVTAFVLVTFSPVAGQNEVSTKEIASVKAMVVPVVCGYLDGAAAFTVVQISGTGFFVDRQGRFLTAAHVLDHWSEISKDPHPCTPAIYIPDHGWQHFEPQFQFHYILFTDCQTDPGLDLSVCQPLRNPFEEPDIKTHIAAASFDRNVWPEGTPVAFTGFPLDHTTPISSKGFIAGHQMVGSDATKFDYLIDKAAWPGASGSPLYLGNGRVVGIIRARGGNEASGLALARSASVIEDFLSKHPHAEQQVPSPDPARHR
jgi:S1-C subfamily serine protease